MLAMCLRGLVRGILTSPSQIENPNYKWKGAVVGQLKDTMMTRGNLFAS